MITVTLRVMCDHCDNEDSGLEGRIHGADFSAPMNTHSKWLQLQRQGWTFTDTLRCPKCQTKKNLCGTHPDYVCLGTSPTAQEMCVGYEKSSHHKYCKWNYNFRYVPDGALSDFCWNQELRQRPKSKIKRKEVE